ncbi:MAG TPA: RHS repeat-associated core domain-containing protein, partial [Variovorax sp.]|nr:RHS repeat-associated core domain-containing protein [Variovorax sp.]
DSFTQLSYMQQRYYDPLIGRFMSNDPVASSSTDGANFNRYWYANNNPYAFTDPDGRAPNQAGVTSYTHVYNALQKSGLADLRDSHGGNANRYFYTEKYGWVDIRHFAEAARMVSEGTSGSVVRGLGFLNEVDQWATEWGDDYRSGFSPEDLPSNDAGINFGESLRSGQSLASEFQRWATGTGAASDPTDPTTGYQDLPATDPSYKGGANRGSNTSSAPVEREIPVVRVQGRIDSMRLNQ